MVEIPAHTTLARMPLSRRGAVGGAGWYTILSDEVSRGTMWAGCSASYMRPPALVLPRYPEKSMTKVHLPPSDITNMHPAASQTPSCPYSTNLEPAPPALSPKYPLVSENRLYNQNPRQL